MINIKRTKRIICCILAVVIAVSAIVLSAANEKNTLNFGIFNTPTGSGYEVTVTVSSDYLCAGMQSVIEYDTSKLVYIGASDNGAVDTSKHGKVKVSKLANDVQNGVKGNLVELTFLSRELIFEDSFTFSNVKGVAVANDNIFASEDTYSFTYGDCNKDKTINIIDFIRMKKMTVDAADEDLSADLDKDGIVNSPDLIVMRKILLEVYTTGNDNRVLNVSDFGAVGDGVTDDSRAIRDAVEALSCYEENAVLNFEAGKTYFVSSKTTGISTAIALTNTDNKTINGNGSTILLDKNMRYMGMTDCENITVKGLNFDLKERSHFVGTVEGKSTLLATDKYIDVTTDRDLGLEGEWTASSNIYGLVSTEDTTSRYYLFISKIVPDGTTEEGKYKYSIYLNTDKSSLGTYTNWSNLENDDKVILPVPNIGHSGSDMINIHDNANVSFEDINVWNSRAFVWVLRRNKDTITFNNVNVMPPEDESVCFSSWRDAFHCIDNSAAITWENCTIEGNGDDIFNLSAGLLYVKEVIASNEVICSYPATNGSYGNPSVGSKVIIYNTATGEIVARTTLKEVVDSATNRYILNDNIDNLTSGENIRFYFDSLSSPNSKIVNCNLDGTMRFGGGPITVEECDIRLATLWLGWKDTECTLPHDIAFNSCDFVAVGGSNTFRISAFNPKTEWKEGLYRLENISFNNCTGLKKEYFENGLNFDINSPDYVTFSPELN